jgi:cytochrome b involved in lipid metabolism
MGISGWFKSSQKEFTQEEVATHNTEQDCWVIVNETIYNLTKFMNNHPGGKQSILNVAGKDGSAIFNAVHGKGPQKFVLKLYKVGVLKV